MMRLGSPCGLSVRKAKSVLALAANRSSTCGVTDSFRVNDTPSALMESTRTKPKVFGGGSDNSRLLRGATKTISNDFTRFNDRLLLVAHRSTFMISVAHEVKFDAGTTRYVSSAYLGIELPCVTG